MRLRHLLFLSLLCLALYFPFLASPIPFTSSPTGLHSTEAHRAIPAWHMLDALRSTAPSATDLLVPRLYHQPYLRKPPGIQWAVAASSALLGPTTLAARLPSALAATLMVFLTYTFTRRWLAPIHALHRSTPAPPPPTPALTHAPLLAALAQALLPWIWSPARAAEIEALNQLGVQLAALAVLDRALLPHRRSLLAPAALALGLFTLAAAKGPAGAPALLGALLAPVLLHRSLRPLADRRLILGLVLGLAATAALSLAIAAAVRSLTAAGHTVVLQSPSAFLFEPQALLRIALLAPTALLFTLPASLALLFPFGPDARREAAASPAARASRQLLLLCTTATLITLAIFTLFGTSNPRYALPAAVFIPPAVAAVAAWSAVGMSPHRVRIARAMCLGHPAVLAAVLTLACWVYIATAERAERATTGEPAGRALAATLTNHSPPTLAANLAADDLIEARPEILWALHRAASHPASAARTPPPRVLWIPNLSQTPPPPGTLFVLRTDAESDEPAWAARELPGWVPLANASGSVHKYTFTTLTPPTPHPNTTAPPSSNHNPPPPTNHTTP